MTYLLAGRRWADQSDPLGFRRTGLCGSRTRAQLSITISAAFDIHLPRMRKRWRRSILAREEGIVPALESAHAIAEVIRLAPTLKKSQVILVNLSGRGDKDVNQVAKIKGVIL